MSPFAPNDLSRLLHERCNSAPPETSERWVSQEKPHKLTTTPARSVSLRVKKELTTGTSNQKKQLRRSPLPAHSFQPDPILEQDEPEPLQAYYDSEYEEDRRNGVPTKVSGNRMRPFKLSMKAEIEAEFADLEQRGAEISARLKQYKPIRESLRDLYFSDLGRGWTVGMWDEFFALEQKYCTLQDELWDLQAQMQELNAQMYLFVNCEVRACDSSSSKGVSWWVNSWKCDGETAVRSVREGGEAGGDDEWKNIATDDAYTRLVWDGVDYNAVSRARYQGRYPEYFAVAIPW
ncbi:hypothetical protein NPX13_g8439 [Xylaria arbuscula]|uniref:Uncharacterized protein n=1 Tax=Xylaria arbuscula TaxID=114810 RepID=A0A9W8N8P3_9PEZI|nr:hypothetical protein NPX13_g8439 [Xylaria arbuscula]